MRLISHRILVDYILFAMRTLSTIIVRGPHQTTMARSIQLLDKAHAQLSAAYGALATGSDMHSYLTLLLVKLAKSIAGKPLVNTRMN
jgi:hypothetical protein